MDDALAKLKRAHEAAPDDVEAARRYEQGLERAGREGEAVALYRLKFACPVRWQDMAQSPTDTVRVCQTCTRQVHMVKSYDELRTKAEQGHCVMAVGRWATLLVDQLAADPATTFAREPARPCVVQGPESMPIPPPPMMLAGAPMPIRPPNTRPGPSPPKR